MITNSALAQLSGRINLNDDFHQLRSSQVELLVYSAKEHGYRKPKNAPGSTARMYYQALQKLWRRNRNNPRRSRRNRRRVGFTAGFKRLLARVAKRRYRKSRRRGRRNPYTIEVWRKPTKGEVKFGYGALHYKTITVKTPPRGGQKFKVGGKTWTYGSKH